MDKDAYQRTLSMSCGGSRRGGNRDEQTGPDGWAVADGAPPTRPARAGDLSNFGKIRKPPSFGPSSVFASKKPVETKRDSTVSRAGSVNMSSALSQNPELANEVGTSNSKSSQSPSRKASIDLGHVGTPEAPSQRRKLNLLPRSVPKEEDRKSTRLNSSHSGESRMPSSA